MDSIRKERFDALNFDVLLPIPPATVNFDEITQEQQCFVSLDSVIKHCSGFDNNDEDAIEPIFKPWVSDRRFKQLDNYDVFISYRWGEDDMAFTEQLFDRLRMKAFDKRELHIFKDKFRLKEGDEFQKVIFDALRNSSIVITVVSHNALLKLVTHNPLEVDNLLLEWLCILIMKDTMGNGHIKKLLVPNVCIKTIQPVIIGTNDSLIEDFFASNLPYFDNSNGIEMENITNIKKKNIVELLPVTIPTATIELAKKLFHDVRICWLITDVICCILMWWLCLRVIYTYTFLIFY